MPLILGMLRLPTAEVAEAMAGTLEGVGQHYRDLAERHRDGVDAGRTPAAFAVTDTVAQLDTVLAGEVDSDPMLEALRPPEGLDVAAWRATLASVIEKSVRPGMAEYRDVLRDVVLPQARPDERCGLHWLEGGADAYERTLRYFTTTRRSAQDIHDVGLAQVAAARRRVPRPRTGDGRHRRPRRDLREDAHRPGPALHDRRRAGGGLEGGHGARVRGDGRLVRGGTQGPLRRRGHADRRQGVLLPAGRGREPRRHVLHQHRGPLVWGTFELEAMAFHEGIPGHHLQLAIAGELPDSYRRSAGTSTTRRTPRAGGSTPSGSADEMGLYATPVDRMGMLAADSMRASGWSSTPACTALGWSRQQAVDYMVANTPLARGRRAPRDRPLRGLARARPRRT